MYASDKTNNFHGYGSRMICLPHTDIYVKFIETPDALYKYELFYERLTPKM